MCSSVIALLKPYYFLISPIASSEAPVLNPLHVPPNLSLGDITEIACSIKRGSTPVTFRWLQDGVDTSTHPKHRISNIGSSSRLVIGKINSNDIGNYTCIVTNLYGEDQKTIHLLIEGEINSL